MENNDVFYTETIRDEKRNAVRSGRGVIIAAGVISVLCGLAIGLGIGIGTGLSRDVIAPYLKAGAVTEESTAMIEAPQATEGFKFDDAEGISAPTVRRDGFASGMGDIIDMTEPSVVCISSVYQSPNAHMFDLPFETTSSGSGIIFHETDDKFYIATNYHVVEGASEINVSAADSEPVRASVLGNDPDADLAVISILKADLDDGVIENVGLAFFGDSSHIRKGDFVIAIGNSGGEGKAAAMGIVSSKEKEIVVSDRELTVIQTDVTLNKGYSGGPLVNINGEVIGINTAKSTYDGMGYSISSNEAKVIIEALMNQKPKPFLGIEGQDVTDEIAESSNIPKFGVLVRSVIPGSSAEKAGIKRSDIITSFGGQPVLTMEQLSETIAGCEVGESVELKILRNGRPVSMTVTLMDYNLIGS